MKLLLAADILARVGLYPKNDAILTEYVKTVSGYRNAMWRAVVALYNHKIDEFDFVGRMADLIADQMRRAYNEGLRSAGLDPAKDMTGAMQKELAEIIDNEDNFVLDFAQDILDNREKDQRPPSTIFKPRIDIWANRYLDVVNRAALAGAEKKGYNLEWKLGATEEHCSTCAALDGTVATAKQWRESGYHPQNPPNDKLACGGWNCDCRLEPTDKEPTIPADGTIIV